MMEAVTETLDAKAIEDRRVHGLVKKISGSNNGANNGSRAKSIVFDPELEPSERRERLMAYIGEKTSDPSVRERVYARVIANLSQKDPDVPVYLGL